MTIIDGTIVTPTTNSRIVRPREMRAMKPATKGLNAITQHQMNTVHQPFQLSCHESIGVIVSSGAVKKLIERKLLMKLPEVCTRFERI